MTLVRDDSLPVDFEEWTGISLGPFDFRWGTLGDHRGRDSRSDRLISCKDYLRR